MNYVNTKDKSKLYVKDWGNGQPVILIHGWPLSADSWDDQAMAIADAGFRAVFYDRRGFGRSSQPWSGYDYDTLSDDLAAVIEYTGEKNVIIIGFSMGGGEVARYMSRHGGKSVSKAGLISSVVPFRLKTKDNPTGTEQEAFDKTAQALNEDRAGFFTGFFKKFFEVEAGGSTVSDELRWNMHNIAMQASLKATLECLKSFSTTDFRGDLAHFKVPTLIIHGTDDKTVPIDASSRPAAKGISQSMLIEYEGAPHGLFATHKEKLTKDLLTFIRKK
ncbi:MAG: alpha/beta hydrolase [Gammaproteobacteria bacterium]|nr:alpha/beta hydrolase [Gammaproteobacteria bacterium]MDP2348293.1 alpha/beta hydrolase [Gammaproteobacteria bacterium]